MTSDQMKAGIPRASILLLAGALILIGHEAWFGADGSLTGGSSAEAATVDPDSSTRPATPPLQIDSTSARPVTGWLPPLNRGAPEPPAPPTIADVRLQRIVHDPGDREASFAVISGWAIRAGEKVGDLSVAVIEKDRVILEDGTELRLP